MTGRPIPAGIILNMTNRYLDLERPEHLKLGMSTIAECSILDEAIQQVLTGLLGDDASFKVSVVFDQIRKPKVQVQVLTDLVNATCEPEDARLFGQILLLCRRASAGRDKLAHRLWSFDSQFPDDVILQHTPEFWKMDEQIRKAGNPTGADLKAITNPAIEAACEIWSLNDISGIRFDAFMATKALIAFRDLLKSESEKDRRLCRTRIVQTLYDRENPR